MYNVCIAVVGLLNLNEDWVETEGNEDDVAREGGIRGDGAKEGGNGNGGVVVRMIKLGQRWKMGRAQMNIERMGQVTFMLGGIAM